jgi:hypothetical protein
MTWLKFKHVNILKKKYNETTVLNGVLSSQDIIIYFR